MRQQARQRRRARPASWIPVLLACALSAVGCQRAASLPDSLAGMQASLVFVVIDAAAAAHVSAYGYPRETAPGLDRLARESLLFEAAYAQAPSTIESVPSYMTGLQPWSIAVRRDRSGPDSLVYLPQRFRAAGFRTAAFSQNINVGISMPAYRLFERFEGYQPGRPRARRPKGPELVRQSLDWIDQAPERPFFLYLHLLPPHSPYEPPPAHRIFADPDYAGGLAPTSRVLADVDKGRIEPTREDVDFLEACYDGNLHYADSLVTSLLSGLRQRGLLDRSVLVVASDHGEAFGQHGRFLHNSTLYDEMLRVPLLVRLPPGLGRPGARVSTRVALVDLAPTLEELFSLGGVLAEQADGRSLVATLATGEEPAARPILAQRDGAAMVIEDGTKLIVSAPDGAPRLYDLAADPGERHDLADRQPEQVLALRPHVDGMLDGRVAGLGLVESLIESLPPEATDQLKALGYLLEQSREGPAASP